jgi:hypothetical protein
MVVMEELGRGIVLEPLSRHWWVAVMATPRLAANGVAPSPAGKRGAGQQERKARWRLDVCEPSGQSGDGWTLTGAKSIVRPQTRPMPRSKVEARWRCS